MTDLKRIIHVSIPFDMLANLYLPEFIRHGINPEISFNYDSLDNFSLKDYEDVAKELQSHGLSITLHAPYIDLCPGSPDPKVKEVARYRFSQILSLIPVFKPEAVVFHTGFEEKKYHGLRDVWQKNSIEIWRWIAEDLKKRSVKFLLENVFERRPEDMILLMEGLLDYENAGLCFDPAHAVVFSIIPIERWLRLISPYLKEIHLHNNSGTWDEHRGLNIGIIDFEEVFQILSKLKREPPLITLEVHKEEEFWPSLEYLEKIWVWD